MKAARLVVLTVAIAAGGVAAMLAGRSEKPPEVKTAPAPQIATVDVLVAKSDIGMGQTVSPGDVQWQEWPASAATGNFIRKTDRPNAIEKLAGSIARVPVRRRRTDPRSQAGQRQGLRLHGRDPAVRHARHIHADFAGDRRRRLHPAERSCRRHPDAPRHATPTKRPAATRTAAKPFSPMSACWRSTRTCRRKTARRSWSARPRRSN